MRRYAPIGFPVILNDYFGSGLTLYRGNDNVYIRIDQIQIHGFLRRVRLPFGHGGGNKKILA
jgi:hypothetical protein